jgi:hypothetical protein
VCGTCDCVSRVRFWTRVGETVVRHAILWALPKLQHLWFCALARWYRWYCECMVRPLRWISSLTVQYCFCENVEWHACDVMCILIIHDCLKASAELLMLIMSFFVVGVYRVLNSFGHRLGMGWPCWAIWAHPFNLMICAGSVWWRWCCLGRQWGKLVVHEWQQDFCVYFY